MQTKSFDEQLESFCNELAPRLETARVLDQELDRQLAPKFNVLDYLKTDELGLSRIIADLLDPKGSHGQGVLFLRAFLEKLEGWKEHRQWPDLDRGKISVHPEWTTDQRRHIDVVVRIEGADQKAHGLAFENKPYDKEGQKNQVKDYLGSLKKEYSERFLLVYLPPTGEGPPESSIPKDELKKWESHFAIMPYVRGQEEWADGFDEYRLPHSLADWLGECRRNCEVDRLRWFLRDMETFCQRRFGGQAMSGDCETKAVKEFVGEDPDKLRTAEAVYKAWPDIKKEVCGRFLERLSEAIEKEAIGRIVGDMQVKPEYAGEARYVNYIWLGRKSWAEYQGGGRSRFSIQSQEVGPNGWRIGVLSPVPRQNMTKEDRERRERLEEELAAVLGPSKGDRSWWAWGSSDWEKRNWDSLVLEPHQGEPGHHQLSGPQVH